MAPSVRLFLTTALLIVGVSCMDAAAQLDISVTPGVVDVECEPGKSAQFTFTVASNAAEAMQCLVAATPMDVDATGIPSPSNEKGLADASPCIKFTPSSFAMPRGESTTVLTAKVTLPRGTSGGRYAIVTFSVVPRAQKSGEAGTGFGIAPEIRAVVMVTAKGTASSAAPKPVAISLTSGREGKGKQGTVWRADVIVRNTGNCHISLDGKIAIKSTSQRRIDNSTLQAGSGLVFPQRERVFTAVGRKTLPDGSYEATVSVAPHGSLRFGSQAVYFTVTNGKVEISGTQKPASSG